MARYLTDLADVLRAAGLKVVEVPGWKTRGRPGSFEPTRVLAHHTGGASDSRAYIDWMATDGRSDLKPPLAQLGLDRKGTWYVMAAGRANHAGRCKPIHGLKAYAGRDYGDGNAQMVGVEAMNTGSEGWSSAQYDSYVIGTAALTNHYGWAPPLGHKETSTSGKWDPGLVDMDEFRRDVAASEGDEMAAADVQEIKDYIRALVVDEYHFDGKTYPGIARVGIETQRRVDRIEGALTALSVGLGSEVEEAVRKALSADYDAKVELTPKQTEVK